MARFDEYFLMSEADAAEYAGLHFFKSDEKLICEEIGDGNLNYVFRVKNELGTKSVIVKQAGTTARISEDMKLSTDRNRIEAEILELEGKLAPGLVPRLYKYDGVMSCCLMEDLTGHIIMRRALIEHEIFPLFTEHITSFLANTLLLTSDAVLEHKEKKAMVKRYINPQLCEITEDLVYTEPFADINTRNILFENNAGWIQENIYADRELFIEAMKLKFEFMNNAQALIHGDLHTGSIFVTRESTKIIDPEFAFYGPMGYDIGNIVANFMFAWVNARATMDDKGKGREAYISWIRRSIIEIIDMFKQKFLACWSKNANKLYRELDTFAEAYLDGVIRDSAGVVGCELSRRVIGLAKVRDITMLEGGARVEAERICLTAAKTFIKERNTFENGEDFAKAFENAIKAFDETEENNE